MANLPSDQIQQARNLFQTSQSIAIIARSNPSLDTIAASLSLYLALSAFGKQTSVVCSTPMTVEFSHLIGIDKITNTINGQNGRNLVISFPYQEGSIEKVSYNIEGNTFNLVIEPRENYPIISPENINYSYSGGNIDLIITIDSLSLVELGNIYSQNQTLFQNKTIVNIDYHNQNTRFGKINLIDPDVSGISEFVVSLLSKFGFTINQDIASNLLAGITSASQNFTSQNTTAATFEAAAICLRYGAKKQNITQPTYSPNTQPPLSTLPTFNNLTKSPKVVKSVSFKPKASSKFMSPTPQQTITNEKSFLKKSSSTFQPQKPTPTENPTHPETPPDWLKPKIYKGSTLL